MNSEQKKVLFLGDVDSPLYAYLLDCGDEVLQTQNRIDARFIEDHGIDFLVSYGYRHIIRADVLKLLPEAAVNLHISYLPWNRGADPNLWSFIEETVKGVSIHYIDEGLDTGDIIAQQQIEFEEAEETLASSYAALHQCIQALFKQHWPAIRNKSCERDKQQGAGSVHRVKDKRRLMEQLVQGWDTPVGLVRQQYQNMDA